MKHSSSVLLVAAVVISFAVAVVTFVTIDRFMAPDIGVAPSSARNITVAVTGSVARPGVVTVPASARLQHVVDAAGGLLPDADVSWLNMAGRVGDGEQIVIPSLGTEDASHEPIDAERESERTGEAPRATPPSNPALLDLNTATATELETLSGIGPVLAQRIVAYRTQHGPFTDAEQLVEIEGISTATLEELLPFIS